MAKPLTLEEVRLLKPLAAKLELLEGGAFPADTEARQHFVRVCSGDVEPETEIERAYLKWRGTKPELALLEQDLIAFEAKAQSLAVEVRQAREVRQEEVRVEKEEKRAARSARLQAARGERRLRKRSLGPSDST
jgi:hypothetical protein